MDDSYKQQIRFVLLTELTLISLGALVGYGFWEVYCGDSWASCLSEGALRPGSYLFLAALRPFILTPIMVLFWMSGESFGLWQGVALGITGALLSAAIIFFPAKFLGRRYVQPWLRTNLPSMLRLIRTQDYKLVFLTRWVPIVPFDLMSLLSGVADFRVKSFFLATALGVIPEAFVFAKMAASGQSETFGAAMIDIAMFGAASITPLLLFEIIYRKRGSSLWMRIKRAYRELVFEIRANNTIAKAHDYHNKNTPIILLYGFFSSRRSLAVVERLLNGRGFQVMSFNLGGLLGVFFTRGIAESAHFIDMKIKRQIKRHQFEKVHIVAHSKGGLVALWWLMKLGGYKYCDKVVTMGTPFKGSWLTYLALITPLGFFWRDVWQMRPRSKFLYDLHHTPIPENVQICCLHSKLDRVSPGVRSLFEPPGQEDRISSVPMNHVTHFDFLVRKDVADAVTGFLHKGLDVAKSGDERETTSTSSL